MTTLVAHGKGNSTDSNGFTTGAINTTGANFIVVGVALGNGVSAGVLSDSKGNTWTPLTQYTNGLSDRFYQLFYSENPTVGTGHTFSITGTANFPSLTIAAFSGLGTSSFDVQNGNQGVVVATSIQPGSITPSVNNELIIAGLLEEDNTTPSVDSGFTISDTVVGGSFGYTSQQFAYLIQTTATAENPTFSWTNSARAIAVIASFKAAAASTAVKTDIGGSLEFLRVVRDDNRFSMESLLYIKNDNLVSNEILVVAKKDTSILLESLVSIRDDEISQTQVLSTTRSDSTIPIESLSVIKDDNPNSIESASSIKNDNRDNLESLVTLRKDIIVPIENLLGVRFDSGIPTEFSGSLVVKGDALIPGECLAAVITGKGNSPWVSIDLGRNGGNPATITTLADLPAGSTAIVVVGVGSGANAGTITDSAGNSYQPLATGTLGSLNAAIFLSNTINDLPLGSSIFSSLASSTTQLSAAGFLGKLSNSVADVNVVGTASASSTITVSGVPIFAGELFIGAVVYNASIAGTSYIQAPGFSSPPDSDPGISPLVGIGGGYLINSGIGQVDFSPSTSNTRDIIGFLVSFRPSPFGYVPIEYLARSKVDNYDSIEDLVSIRNDSVLQNELTGNVQTASSSDSALPLEVLSGSKIDASGSIEKLTVSLARSEIIFEDLSSATQNVDAPLESLKSSSSRSVPPLENLSSSKVDISANLENSSNQQVDINVNNEILLSVKRDISDPLESLTGVRFDSVIPLEDLSITKRDFIVPAEFMAVERIDALVSLESLVGVRDDRGNPVEALTGVKSDFEGQLENSGTNVTFSRSVLPLESLSGERADTPTNLETVANQKIDINVNDEILLSIKRDISDPLEYLNLVRGDSQTNVEWTGTAGVVIHAAAQVEFLAGVLIRQDPNLESIANIRIDFSPKLEALLGVRRESATPLEDTGAVSIRGDSSANLEFLGKVIADALGELEWTAQFTSLRSDSATSLEFSITIQADSVFSFEQISAPIISQVILAVARVSQMQVKVNSIGQMQVTVTLTGSN